jgi:hypothetical protein
VAVEGPRSEFVLEVTRGYVRLVRRWVGARPVRPPRRRAAWERPPVGVEAEDGLGRGDSGLSRRSANNMRRLFLALPWELLGPWPAMLTLTYPGDWRLWVPDGRTWERHRINFAKRWRREWGPRSLVGVWAKEFQASGRPHLHLYIGLPSEMAGEDFEGLRQRTVLGWKLVRRYGTYAGRKRVPAIGGKYGGEFAMWARTAWAEVVGTQGVVQAHHARGVDVRVMFTDEAQEQAVAKDRTEVAAYLAREAGKYRQKEPPEGFVRVGQYYGTWGRAQGFVPVVDELPLSQEVARQVEKRLARWVRWKLHAGSLRLVNNKWASTPFDERREGDGVTAFGLGPDAAARVLKWSEAAAARKAARWAARDARRAG